jgi:hypothetical protein
MRADVYRLSAMPAAGRGALWDLRGAADRLLLLMARNVHPTKDMKRFLSILLGLLLFALPLSAQRFSKCNSCTRDGRGRIARSAQAKKEFTKAHPCPAFNLQRSTVQRSTACPGYQVDHVKPLACGGEDSPRNMQWLTVAEHRAKSKRDATCGR